MITTVFIWVWGETEKILQIIKHNVLLQFLAEKKV